MNDGSAYRTREQHAEETRATILREARRLFMELGYRAVSTRMVAEAAHVTQPALYHHFSGKEDLYVAVLTRELGDMGARLAAIAERTEPVLDRLQAAAAYLLSRTHHNLTLMQHDIRTELSDSAAANVGAHFFDTVVSPLTRVVEDGMREGLIASPELLGLTSPQIGLYFLHQVSFVSRPPARTNHTQAFARHLERQSKERLIVSLFLHGVGRQASRD